jgi:hypothetical protein
VSCCKERVKNGIISYSGMISKLRFNQRAKRVLIQGNPPLPEVEREGEEISLQPQSINTLLPLSWENEEEIEF